MLNEQSSLWCPACTGKAGTSGEDGKTSDLPPIHSPRNTSPPPKKMSCLFLSDRYQKKCLGVFFGHSQQTFQLIMSKIEGFIYSIYIYIFLFMSKEMMDPQASNHPTIQPVRNGRHPLETLPVFFV